MNVKMHTQHWQNSNPPWASGPARYFIVGSANTGKTTLASKIIRHLLTDEYDVRNQLVIVSPNFARDDKLQQLSQFAAKIGLVVMVYTSLDKRSMQKFVAYMDECALKRMRTTVFIDDPVGVGSFTSSVNSSSAFNSFVTGAKHYKADIVFSTQVIGSMSKSARKNVDVFIFLPDMISRVESYTSCRFVSTQIEFDKLMDKYATRPFNALWINVQFGRKGVYYVNEAGNISAITTVPE